MSDLRSKLAAILKNADGQWDEKSDPHLNQADALIRELRLHEERGRIKVTRYVTDWRIDNG